MTISAIWLCLAWLHYLFLPYLGIFKMSTRATYCFKKADEFFPDVYLYVHHDNYPEGAVHYIYAAFQIDGNMSAESFIRANERAQITREHNVHGDTEYRYTFNEDQLTARRGYGDNWSVFFTGPWWEFIDQYQSEDYPIDNYEPIKPAAVSEYSDHTRPFTKSQLEAQRDDSLRLLGIWSVNGHSESANYRNLVQRIGLMDTAINGFPS